MIEKLNYENVVQAREKINSLLTSIKSNEISFEEAVSASSEDLASKDLLGDLGMSSGNAFPIEFEDVIATMQLDAVSSVIELEDSFHILKLTEVIKPEIKSKAEMAKTLIEELVDTEALALMQDDFLKLESLVLDGVTLNELAESINVSVEVTGLKNAKDISLNSFTEFNSADLFDASLLANKIEIFEGEESYAFVMLTQAIEPSVQPFASVADLAIKEVRVAKANKALEEFSADAESVLTGEKILPSDPGYSQESFKAVKRFSSLLPSEIISATFESPIGTVVNNEAFNGDRYWAESSNEVIPSTDELGDSLEQYQAFYNETLTQQFSGFVDRAFKEGQRVRLKNFAVN